MFVRNHQSSPSCLKESCNQMLFVPAVKTYVIAVLCVHGHIQRPLFLQPTTRDDPFMFLPIAIPEKHNVWSFEIHTHTIIWDMHTYNHLRYTHVQSFEICTRTIMMLAEGVFSMECMMRVCLLINVLNTWGNPLFPSIVKCQYLAHSIHHQTGMYKLDWKLSIKKRFLKKTSG